MQGLRRTRSSAREALQKSAAIVTSALEVPEPKPKRVKRAQSVQTSKKSSTLKTVGGPPEGISRYYEKQQWDKGFKSVAGIDEAGRGPLAGPVVAAACIIPPAVHIDGIDDSKKINPEERERLYELITSHPDIIWAVQAVDVTTIDTINILQATMQAMEQAAAGLTLTADYLLVDGNRLPKGFDPETSKAITKGDAKVYAIAAASIIAKVTRDRLMVKLHEQYPQYDFNVHMGYGVPKHVEAIRKHGPCPAHRRSFNPVKSWYPAETEDGNEGDTGPGAEIPQSAGLKTKAKKK